MRRRSETDEQRAFRQTVRAFLTEKVAPHAEAWEREGLVPRSLYAEFGALGVTGLQVPEEYGGGGEASFAYQAILTEEIVATGAATGCAAAAPERRAALLPRLRHPRAAGPLVPRVRLGNAGHRDRDDRARHRLRPRRDHRDGGPGR